MTQLDRSRSGVGRAERSLRWAERRHTNAAKFAFFERVRVAFRRNLAAAVGADAADGLSRVLLSVDIGLATSGKLPAQRDHLRSAVTARLDVLSLPRSAAHEAS